MKKLLVILFLFPIMCSAQLVINEFSSTRGVKDYYDKDCDWIELINIDSTSKDLSSYFISDNINNLQKWQLPAEHLDFMQKILILCSGDDKKNKIHHFEDIINAEDQWSYFLGHSNPDTNWREITYNDSAWSLGYMGFGFDDNDDSTYITGVSSLYLRKSFNIIDKEELMHLILDADYDDSFIAYLNGVELARSNNINGILPNYNQLAWYSHDASIVSGDEYESYIINKNIIDSVIRMGDNILAIQVHDVDSIPDDMSARFFLHAGINSESISYFPTSAYFKGYTTYYHSNFKISNSETLFISDSTANIIDQKSVSSIPLLISQGRSPDGIDNWCYFSEPTPGLSNDTSWCYDGITDPPIVSLSSGWYENKQHVTITTTNNTDVFYTTNGDIPDTNDYKYTDTLFFDTTIVLSVSAISIENKLNSETIDRTYIFNEDNFDLPVFSIITDSVNLWDWNSGIYVLGPNANPTVPNSGANFWKSWSKLSRLEFFDKNRDKQAEEYFDLEIHGGRSRSSPQKSFRLDFKSRYSGNLEYPLFSEKPYISSLNNINLRNGGSWPGNRERIRDGFLSSLASATHIDFMAYEPCLLYLNGVYWGQYGIREKIDGNYIENNHSISSNNIDLLNRREALEGVDKEFINSYHEIMNTDPNSTNFFYLIDSIFDINNYIDYFIFETYIQNKDWYAGKNNIKLWREKGDRKKWRYILFDTDQTFWLYNGSYYDPNIDFISHARDPYHIDDSTSMSSYHSEIFNRVMFNNQFKCKFANRYADLVNTVFDSTYFANELHNIKDKVQGAIPSQVNRWGQPSSFSSWESYINNIISRNSKRSAYALDHVSHNLLLGSLYNVVANVFPNESGKVKINSIIPDYFPWDGLMFNNLCPSNILALADTGYVFSHWNSNHIIGSQIYNDTIDLYLSQDDTITAHFRACRINNLSLIQDSMGNRLAPTFDIGYGPYSYKWFLDNDIIFAAEDSIFFPKKTGMYSVSVTDKDGCNTVSPSIFFDCNILVEVDFIQDTITNSLNVSCTGGTSPYTYDWFYNNTPIIALFDSTHFPLETGSYHFLLTDSNGCQSLSDTIFTKDCGFVIESSLIQDTITNNLHINSFGGTYPYSYQWFLNSIFVEDIDKSFLDIYTLGTYYAIIEDINGCRSFTDTISNNRLEVNVFPNPTSELMNLKFIRLSGDKYTISVFDIHMNILHYIELPKIYHNMLYTHTFNLDLNITGLYFIRLESSDNQISKRFIYLE